MTQIVLTLTTPAGPFVFTREEVPEKILHGGAQALSVDRMIGGRRIVHPLGPNEDDITFSGVFAYQGTARSDFLDSVRRRGDSCTLTWDNRILQVVISAYRPTYFKPYLIGYTITFLVVSNQSAILDSVPAVTPMQQLKLDNSTLLQHSACAGIPVISSLASGVDSALSSLQQVAQPIANGLRPITSTINGVSDCVEQVANQLQTATAAVAAPIAQLLASTQKLITNTEGLISSTASFGGIIPGNPVAQSVGGYLSQVNNIAQLPALYSISSLATRMQGNLGLI